MLASFLAVGSHSGAGRRGLLPLGWRTGVLLSVLRTQDRQQNKDLLDLKGQQSQDQDYQIEVEAGS